MALAWTHGQRPAGDGGGLRGEAQREGGAETQTGRQSRKTNHAMGPPTPARLSFQWAPAKGSPRWGSGPSHGPCSPLPSQPVLPLTRLALRNYGLVIGSNTDHAVCGARGRQSGLQGRREGEGMGGCGGGGGWSGVLLPEHPGPPPSRRLTFPSSSPSVTLSHRRNWKRPCLVTGSMGACGGGGRGQGASFRAQGRQSPLF